MFWNDGVDDWVRSEFIGDGLCYECYYNEERNE